ncbi:hypothetical protein PAMP_007690 [Pampus punctatissimus]
MSVGDTSAGLWGRRSRFTTQFLNREQSATFQLLNTKNRKNGFSTEVAEEEESPPKDIGNGVDQSCPLVPTEKKCLELVMTGGSFHRRERKQQRVSTDSHHD